MSLATQTDSRRVALPAFDYGDIVFLRNATGPVGIVDGFQILPGPLVKVRVHWNGASQQFHYPYELRTEPGQSASDAGPTKD